jgi:hypothetical protein
MRHGYIFIDPYFKRLYYINMKKKNDFKPMEISGQELDSFIKKLVDRIYDEIWADISIGPEEQEVKKRLTKSIIEALKEYAEYK